ncbi:hypothetical protein CTI12_AA143160 [Artemisia annua]|uniref:OTU domain-containing protein n=1 Tax=Artemisia annua TaxID=35608 RepID=A0A2U1PKG1_ARTAN|nr:hypothetical protein CTI12_AA143160 [Artemisia annua]
MKDNDDLEEYVEDPEEQELLRQRRQLFRFIRKIVIGDGACVFRSVSDQMYHSQFWYGDVRKAACDQMRNNPKLYMRGFTKAEYDAYIDKMSLPWTCADHLVTRAICDAFQLTIIELGSDPIRCFREYHPTKKTTVRSRVDSRKSAIIKSELFKWNLAEIPLSVERMNYMKHTGCFYEEEVCMKGRRLVFNDPE